MDKKKLLLLAVIAIPGLAALAYLSGLLAQLLANYALWQELGGMNSPEPIQAPSLDPGVCFPALLSIHGLKSVLLILGKVSCSYWESSLQSSFISAFMTDLAAGAKTRAVSTPVSLASTGPHPG